MKPQEIIHFDKERYLQTIANKYATDDALKKEILKKRGNRLISGAHSGINFLAIPFTGGLSGLSAVMDCRNISVESQKLRLLELEWASRGNVMIPERIVEDKLIPMTLAIGTGLIDAVINVDLSGFIHIPGTIPDQGLQPLTPPSDIMPLNGHSVSKVLCTEVERHEVRGISSLLGEAVDAAGDQMTTEVVTNDSKSAPQTRSLNNSTTSTTGLMTDAVWDM